MAMTKEVLSANARNDGRGVGIAGRARNDRGVTYAGGRMPPLHRSIRVRAITQVENTQDPKPRLH